MYLPDKRHAMTRMQLIAICTGILLLLVLLPGGIILIGFRKSDDTVPISKPSTFFASVDTMKESRDTETRPLSLQEIQNIVKVSASVHANYITVDTNLDYPNYMQEWVNAIRATGHHVWFRPHINQWENENGAGGIMTPKAYEDVERNFILAHASLFKPGDILDPCSEPEQGHYWHATYQAQWTSHAPNTATREYNQFLRDTTIVADSALYQKGVYGVITGIRSTNSFFATHPDVLEQATVNKFGYITVDSYPEGNTTDPTLAAQGRLQVLKTIETIWHVPVVVGELGYSNNVNVDDTTQQQVLKGELQAMATLPYLAGVNYWVGPGSPTAGGYTYIFRKSHGAWILRPAAYELSAFYKAKVGS